MTGQSSIDTDNVPWRRAAPVSISNDNNNTNNSINNQQRPRGDFGSGQQRPGDGLQRSGSTYSSRDRFESTTSSNLSRADASNWERKPISATSSQQGSNNSTSYSNYNNNNNDRNRDRFSSRDNNNRQNSNNFGSQHRDSNNHSNEEKILERKGKKFESHA